MSRGSHRELAINEGKSDEVQTEHLPSFPLLDVYSFCRGLPRTWFDLEALVSFYYHFWHPCLNHCDGCRRVWRHSERRPGREVWAIFYIIANRGKPNNQSQVGMVDFLGCVPWWHISWDGPKGRNLIWKCSNRFGTGLTKEDIKSMFKIQWVRDDAFGWPFSWGGSHAICYTLFVGR